LRPISASCRSLHDDLKRTWYTVLGVTEKATPMEIEEAFHRKLTESDDLMSKTPDEVDRLLEQSVDYMDAYKVLSHPSKRIEYDTRLKMYRRGTLNTREQSNVSRTRQGAFLKLDREKETKEKKMTAGEKADEMIKDFYAETTHTPTMLKEKLDLQENITHSQKMPDSRGDGKSDKASLKEQLSDISQSHADARVAKSQDGGSQHVMSIANRVTGVFVCVMIALFFYKSKTGRVSRTSEFDSAYEEQMRKLKEEATAGESK